MHIFSKSSENKTFQDKILKSSVQGPCCRSPSSQHEPNSVPEVLPGSVLPSVQNVHLLFPVSEFFAENGKQVRQLICYNTSEVVYNNGS